MLGKWVRAQRLWRGWSQAVLAEKVGVTPQAISLLEQGKRANPGGQTLTRLAQAFEITLDDLLIEAGLASEQQATQGAAEAVEQATIDELLSILPALTPADRQRLVNTARAWAGRDAQYAPQRATRARATANPQSKPDNP